jgi:chitinase
VGVIGYELYFGSISLGVLADTSMALMGFKAWVPYVFTVRARDAAGNVSQASNQITVLLSGPDTTPPSIPTNLKATSVTSNSISLSWTASTDNVGTVGYSVYANNASPSTVFVTQPSTTIRNLSPSITYAISVVAVDAAGNCSSRSAWLSVITAAR